MNLVTVIIPVGKKHRDTVHDALASLLQEQTFNKLDVIVVNDSGKPLNVFGNDTLRVLDTGGNKWTGCARNMGIDAAQTPFVSFLDADDALSNTGVEMLVRGVALYPDASYVYGDAWSLTRDGLVYFQAREYDRELQLHRNLHTVTALVPTCLAREIRFDETIHGWEDWDFYLRMGHAGYCGRRVAHPVITYRIETGTNRSDSAKINNLYADIRRKNEGVAIMACCGGNPDEIEQARAAIAGLMPGVDANGSILMEYTGQNLGTKTFKANGRSYRGANTPSNKRSPVDSRDVEALLAMGVWRVAPMPSAPTRPHEFAVDMTTVPGEDSEAVTPDVHAEDNGDTNLSAPIVHLDKPKRGKRVTKRSNAGAG